MELLSVNFSGRVRREELNGRKYLVAPATMIVPGVLPGSKGPLYYPPDEVALNPGIWNGVPITRGHPVDNLGNPVSARIPQVMSKVGLGYVYNDAYVDGNRTAEMWFDEELTKAKAPKTYQKLLDNEPGEISTGLYTDDYPAVPGATHNGTPFTHVARNYRPDHLAVLEDQAGACSLKDGCGMLVGNDLSDVLSNDDEEITSNEVFPMPALDRLTFLQRFLGWLTGNAGKGQPRSMNTGKYKRYGSGTGKGPAHEAAQRGFTILNDRDRELGKDAAFQLEQTGHNPPNWAVDEDKWERAKEAADKGNYDGDQYWAVVAHIYQKMGGTIQGNQTNNYSSTTIDVDDQLLLHEGMALVTNDEGESTMPTRQEKINLVTNCKCGLKPETVNRLSDEELDELLQNARAAAEIKKGVKLGSGLTLVFNAKKGKTVYRNEKGEECDPEDADCMGMAENIDGDDCEGEDQDSECRAMFAALDRANNAASTVKGNRRLAGNSVTPEMEEALAKRMGFKSAAAMRATLNAAKNVELQERQNRVRKLVANLRGDEQKRMAQKLLKKSVPELDELISLIPDTRSQATINEGQDDDLSFLYAAPLGNYVGAGGAPHYALTSNEHEEILDLDAERLKYDPIYNQRKVTA